jgi:methylated-DNA-protein-cysteine methyltransferase related protein
MSMWYPPNDKFFETVWLITRQIPKGKVSSYGQIASMIPPYLGTDPDQHQRLAPRWVGTAMRKVPEGQSVPWQRVINSQGKVSLPDASGAKQRALLEAEGIVFDKSGKINLGDYGWQGPDDDWLDEHNLLPPNQFESKPKQKPLF